MVLDFPTADNLLFLKCSIQEAFIKNDMVAVLDTQNAYDTVWVQGL